MAVHSIEMSRDEILALCERREASINRLDVDALMKDYAEECVVESPTAGGIVRGRAVVRQIFQRWFDTFKDLHVKTVRVLVDDHRAVQVLDVRGTDLGGFLGLPATRKPFRISLVFLTEFEGRRIARELRVYDFTGVLIQVGHLKAKPA